MVITIMENSRRHILEDEMIFASFDLQNRESGHYAEEGASGAEEGASDIEVEEGIFGSEEGTWGERRWTSVELTRAPLATR